MDQGSDQWLQWRREGIGASDAPIIMGLSPYKTPFQLWEEKTGRHVDTETPWAARMGNQKEPLVRAHYELLRGVECPPLLCVHPSWPIFRASLDGYDKERNVIIEIKCPGKAEHQGAKEGRVPEKYYPQCQHQLMVTGADRVDYVSHNVDFAIVEVYPDRDYISSYIQKACAFWDLVQKDQPPPFVDKDYFCIRSRVVRDLLDNWHSYRGTEFEEQARYGAIMHEKATGKERWRCGPYRIADGKITIAEPSEDCE